MRVILNNKGDFVCALKRRAADIRPPWLRGISRDARSRLRRGFARRLSPFASVALGVFYFFNGNTVR